MLPRRAIQSQLSSNSATESEQKPSSQHLIWQDHVRHKVMLVEAT